MHGKPSSYFCGPRTGSQSATVRAVRISKTAWMDLYYDLYVQTHGEASPEVVIADVEKRLRILTANGIRC